LKSSFLSIGSQRVPSAGGIQYRRILAAIGATESCMSMRQWPERLGIGSGNRSIEEVY